MLSWNCRGLGNPSTIQVLLDLVQSKRVIILFLCETLIAEDRLEGVGRRLGLGNCFGVDCVGHSGGLTVFW